MATPTEIRVALGEHLERIPKLVVHPRLTTILNLGDGGGAVIGGPTASYPEAQGRGLMTWNFPIYLLAPTSDYDRATDILDELVSPYGERSVRQMVWDYGRGIEGGAFGVLDSNGRPNLDANIDELVGYGVVFPDAGIDHIAAVLNCAVLTPGKPT